MTEVSAASGSGATQGAAASKDVGSVVDYLSRTGNMYKQHIELLRRRQEEEEKAAAPFKPTITPYAEEVARFSKQRQSETVEDRLFHLHQKKLEREARARERQKAAEDAAVSALRFEPQITRRAERRERREDLPDALLTWMKERDARTAQLQEQQLQVELSQRRDRPHISAFAQEAAARGRPQDVSIEDHLLLEEERRRRRQYALTELHWNCFDGDAKDSVVQDARGTSSLAGVSSIHASSTSGAPRKWFSPSISARASRLQRPGSVSERLYRQPLEQSREEELYDEVYETNCTFQPELSAFSRQLSHSRYADPAVRAAPAHERLYRNPPAEPRHRKRPIVTAAAEEAALHPHQPQISETSRALVEAMRLQQSGGGGESPGTRLHRSALEGHRMDGDGGATSVRKHTYKKSVITPKELEAMEETTFKPKVSARSQELWARKVNMLKGDGHARNEEEARSLLWRQARKKREDDLRQRKALETAETMLECTFQPQAGRAPVGKLGYEPAHTLTVAERTQLWSQQKERRLEQLKAELAADEESSLDADCTFQPLVHEAYPLPHRHEPSRAERNFLRRQEEARERRAAAARWWQPKGTRHVDGGDTSAPPPRPRHTTIDGFTLGAARTASVRRQQQQLHATRSASRSSVSASTDSEDEDDFSFQPHYPEHGEQSAQNGDRPFFLPHHHQPQQPSAMYDRSSLVMEEDGREASASAAHSASVTFRPIPATRAAEWRKPSPLDAYRGAV